MSKIYLLDNFDSFTYNLVDEFKTLGFELVVYRNDIDASIIKQKMDQETQSVILVLSPGPGAPSKAGCLIDLIKLCKGQYPILGICLGHQAIVEQCGGTVGHAGETIHGKLSAVDIISHPVFKGFDAKLNVARYHSLMATKVPDSLQVIAKLNTNSGEIPMAVADDDNKVIGYQFHPESILTTNGAKLLHNTLNYLASEKAASTTI